MTYRKMDALYRGQVARLHQLVDWQAGLLWLRYQQAKDGERHQNHERNPHHPIDPLFLRMFHPIEQDQRQEQRLQENFRKAL